MIRYTQGNLLEAKVDALVNTVNTVGVMGKGIALMFKDAFRANYLEYRAACRRGEVVVGKMFVTERLSTPRWLVNFPTKMHWRDPSKLEWIVDGLADLNRVIAENEIRSIAVPPLGCGHGGLAWELVRPEIETALSGLPSVEVWLYEPTAAYQNVPKRAGLEKSSRE